MYRGTPRVPDNIPSPQPVLKRGMMAAQYKEQAIYPPKTPLQNTTVNPSYSYQVVIEGEKVAVPGASLKPMKSKKGYYRLLKEGKLYVLHSSEVKELARTEGEDSDFEVTPSNSVASSPGAPPPFNTSTYNPHPSTQRPTPSVLPAWAYSQLYSVKINRVWVTLPQAVVQPSNDRPGHYRVSHQGQVYTISAVDVIPLPLGSAGHDRNNPVQTAAPLAIPVPNMASTPLHAPTSTEPKRGTRSWNSHHGSRQSIYTQNNPALIQNLDRLSQKQGPPQAPNTFSTHTSAQVPLTGVGQPTTNEKTLQDNAARKSSRTGLKHETKKEAMKMENESLHPIKSKSFVISKPDEGSKVRILVRGTWKTIEKKNLKPSKKQPGTYIARLDGKNIRLLSNQISEYKGEQDDIPESPQKLQVFIDGMFVVVDQANVADSPAREGYKIVTHDGITQLIHKNFVFQVDKNSKAIVPHSYQVVLPTETITVSKDNVKPDSTLPNTFMVLVNGTINRVSAENLTPIFKDATKPFQLVRSTKENNQEIQQQKPAQKLEIKKRGGIPARPEGIFPSKESFEDSYVSRIRLAATNMTIL